MPAPRPREFRRRAVELARQGEQPVAVIAKDLGITESCLRGWMAIDDIDAGRAEGVERSGRYTACRCLGLSGPGGGRGVGYLAARGWPTVGAAASQRGVGGDVLTARDLRFSVAATPQPRADTVKTWFRCCRISGPRGSGPGGASPFSLYHQGRGKMQLAGGLCVETVALARPSTPRRPDHDTGNTGT